MTASEASSSTGSCAVNVVLRRRGARLLSKRWLAPGLRSRGGAQHRDGIPAALAEGGCAVWPLLTVCPHPA